MSSCKKCDKYNPFSVFSFLRTATRTHKQRSSRSNSRKTMKGGWRKKGSGKNK